ncbi:TPA: hypothetical protein HA246_01900 [Candidatus Woesearchaeota archaeon]|nr:hypothetical protein [Candidatus Woesearchaeota archaeon]
MTNATATLPSNITGAGTLQMNLIDRILTAVDAVYQKLGEDGSHDSLVNPGIETAIQAAKEVTGGVPLGTEYSSLRGRARELMLPGTYDKSAALFAVIKYDNPTAQAYFEFGLALVGAAPSGIVSRELRTARDAFLQAYTLDRNNEAYLHLLLKTSQWLSDYAFIRQFAAENKLSDKAASQRNLISIASSYLNGLNPDLSMATAYLAQALVKSADILNYSIIVIDAEISARKGQYSKAYDKLEMLQELLDKTSGSDQPAYIDARREIGETLRAAIDRGSFVGISGDDNFEDLREALGAKGNYGPRIAKEELKHLLNGVDHTPTTTIRSPEAPGC